jgi:hypothetical protein
MYCHVSLPLDSGRDLFCRPFDPELQFFCAAGANATMRLLHHPVAGAWAPVIAALAWPSRR